MADEVVMIPYPLWMRSLVHALGDQGVMNLAHSLTRALMSHNNGSECEARMVPLSGPPIQKRMRMREKEETKRKEVSRREQCVQSGVWMTLSLRVQPPEVMERKEAICYRLEIITAHQTISFLTFQIPPHLHLFLKKLQK